jgi:hypothetical protein
MTKAQLLNRLLCVALVASVVMLVGRDLYPYVSSMLDTLQFDAAEAVVSATVGFAIYAVMFGS